MSHGAQIRERHPTAHAFNRDGAEQRFAEFAAAGSIVPRTGAGGLHRLGCRWSAGVRRERWSQPVWQRPREPAAQQRLRTAQRRSICVDIPDPRSDARSPPRGERGDPRRRAPRWTNSSRHIHASFTYRFVQSDSYAEAMAIENALNGGPLGQTRCSIHTADLARSGFFVAAGELRARQWMQVLSRGAETLVTSVRQPLWSAFRRSGRPRGAGAALRNHVKDWSQ